MTISEMMEDVLRRHQERMTEIDNNARDQAALLGSENVRNILRAGDVSAQQDQKLGVERINKLVDAVSGGKHAPNA